MIADLHIRNCIGSPDREPETQKRRYARSITPHYLSTQSDGSGALGHDAGEYGDDK